MGLENRRSGNASVGSNPTLSAISPANATVSDARTTRCSCTVPTYADGPKVGTLTKADWYWRHECDCPFYGDFHLGLFQHFLAKCGYEDGRQGVPPTLEFGMASEEDFIRWGEKATEYTYFAVGRHSGLIKIGMSKQPRFRVSRLQNDANGTGEQADLILYRSLSEWERMYHDAFHPWRITGEWFAPHPDILAEIERIKALGLEQAA